MPQCAFKNCINNHRNTKVSEGLSFFRFPGNPFRRAQWVSIVARERGDKLYKPTKTSSICSIHFDEFDITGNTQRRRLLKTAIPKLHIYIQLKKKTMMTSNRVQIKKYGRNQNKINLKSNMGKVTLSSTVAGEGQEIRYEIPESKELILRVYRYLREEYEQLKVLTENKCDLSVLENTLERTAIATGVSEKTIAAILKEKELLTENDKETAESPAKRRKLDDESGDVRQEEHEEQHDSEGDHDCGTEVKQEQDDYAVQTLKIEYEDHEYYPYEEIGETITPDLRTQDEAQSTVDNSSSTVKSEPDPLSAPCPSLAHITPATLTTVKSEPDDDELLDLDAAPSLDKFNIQLYKGEPLLVSNVSSDVIPVKMSRDVRDVKMSSDVRAAKVSSDVRPVKVQSDVRPVKVKSDVKRKPRPKD